MIARLLRRPSEVAMLVRELIEISAHILGVRRRGNLRFRGEKPARVSGSAPEVPV